MPYRRRALVSMAALAALCLPLLAYALPEPAGEARLISDPSPWFKSEPTVAAASQGRFLSVWNNARSGLERRFVNAAGEPVGQELLLVENLPFPDGAGTYPYRHNQQPALVSLGPGQGYVLFFMQETGTLRYSWFHVDLEVDDREVLGLRLDNAGRPVGESFAVAAAAEGWQEQPSAALLSSGEVLVAWQVPDLAASSAEIRGRLYSPADGGFGAELALNGEAAFVGARPQVLASPDGGFLSVWAGFDEHGTGVLARRFDAAGAALGDAVRVNESFLHNQLTPVATPAAGGGYLVGWQGVVQPLVESRIFVRRIDAAGAPFGPEQMASDAEASEADAAPALASLPGGGFIVFWVGWWDDFPAWVLGQELGSDGAPIGATIEVSGERPLSQRRLAVATRQGEVFVAWEGWRGRRKAVAARSFEQRGAVPVTLRLSTP